MKHPLRWLALPAFVFGTLSLAAADVDFNLLPRAFQKNPRVDFNVVTEMTKEGRQAPQASPSAPIYYVDQPGSFVERGLGAAAGETRPAVARMQKALQEALAQSGYRPASEGHPPSIAIIYAWGSHTSATREDVSDPDAGGGDAISNEARVNDMIERARIVGGEKFATDLIKAMAEEGAARRATAQPRGDPTGTVATQPNTAGEAAGALTSLFSPVERFRRKSDKNRSLMEDATGSVYFVVASAYDFSSARTNSKILLWRTKMSVSSAGLSMGDTMPSLITAAGPFFGKDMPEVEVLNQRLHRTGTVRLAPMEVEEFYESGKAPKLKPEATPAPAKEPPAAKEAAPAAPAEKPKA